MTDRPLQAEIKTAARWWADQLRGTPKQETGDAMANAMMASFQEQDGPNMIDEDKILAFETHLVELLTERDNLPDLTIVVDYGPDYMLYEASTHANILITSSTFPVKTHMLIAPGQVVVSCGYGAPRVELPLLDAEPVD